MTTTQAKKEQQETVKQLRSQLDAMVNLCAAQLRKIQRLERELARLRRGGGGHEG